MTLNDGTTVVPHGGTAASTDIFQILADDYARKILLAADNGPKTAKTLSEECDASLTTIYRRVSTLQEHGLIEERHTVDSDGSHRSEFETALEELHVDISDGQLSLTVETRDELADNFTSLWSDLRGDD
ncbi:ArsR/SmtB family transcription factor [Natronococcus pandeyae]|uniref:ArsR/SmtB family transcription factor n=1 Tax=Natronococcus pandeyae TaxID=2055836 RepID=UPI001F35FF89|nr:helix-turn-helix domain-containing protein [Natronococcus pandeyae]